MFADNHAESLSKNQHDRVHLIHINAFKTADEAKALMTQLGHLELPIHYEVIKDTYYRVLVGPYADNREMELANVKLKERNFSVLPLSRQKNRSLGVNDLR